MHDKGKAQRIVSFFDTNSAVWHLTDTHKINSFSALAYLTFSISSRRQFCHCCRFAITKCRDLAAFHQSPHQLWRALATENTLGSEIIFVHSRMYVCKQVQFISWNDTVFLQFSKETLDSARILLEYDGAELHGRAVLFNGGRLAGEGCAQDEGLLVVVVVGSVFHLQCAVECRSMGFVHNSPKRPTRLEIVAVHAAVLSWTNIGQFLCRLFFATTIVFFLPGEQQTRTVWQFVGVPVPWDGCEICENLNK